MTKTNTMYQTSRTQNLVTKLVFVVILGPKALY